MTNLTSGSDLKCSAARSRCFAGRGDTPKRSLLALNDSSVLLQLTSTSFNIVPSLDLLVTVSVQGNPLQAPLASSIVSLSDVPADTTLAPNEFPVHSISATFASPVNTAVLWKVFDARTCTGGANDNTPEACGAGALLWNATTLPGDMSVINGTILYRNFTSQNAPASIFYKSITPDKVNFGAVKYSSSGLYGILQIADQTGSQLSISNKGGPVLGVLAVSCALSRLLPLEL